MSVKPVFSSPQCQSSQYFLTGFPLAKLADMAWFLAYVGSPGPGNCVAHTSVQCSAAWLKENIFPHTQPGHQRHELGQSSLFVALILQYGISWIRLKGTDAPLYEWHFSDIFVKICPVEQLMSNLWIKLIKTGIYPIRLTWKTYSA